MAAPADWITGVLAHMKDHCGDRLTLAGLARVAGRAPRTVRQGIRSRTGKGFSAYLLELRVARACELLTRSALPIGRIASVAGFGHPANLSKRFRRETGLSPRTYRDRNRRPSSGEERTSAPARPGDVVFRSAFGRGAFSREWTVVTGSWEETDGEIRGESAENCVIELRRELPPAFALRAELMHEPAGAAEPAGAISISASGRGRLRASGYVVFLGDANAGANMLRREGTAMDERPGGFPVGQWVKVRLRLARDGVVVSAGGRELLRSDELLALPHRDRSVLALGGFHSRIRIRSVEIAEVSVSPARPETARGDALWEEGKPEHAAEAYEEELARSRGGPGEEELLYRLGMAYLRLGLKVRARAHLDRFCRLRPGSHWSIAAAVASLETRVGEIDLSSLEDAVRELFAAAATPASTGLILDFLERATLASAEAGDFDRSLALLRVAFELVPPLSLRARTVAHGIVDHLLVTYRFREAVALLEDREFLARLNTSDRSRVLMYGAVAYAALGRYADARRVFRPLSRGSNRWFAVRGAIREGLVLQAEGKLERAMRTFVETTRTFRDMVAQARTAAIFADHLAALSGEGKDPRHFDSFGHSKDDPLAAWEQLHLRGSLLAINGRFEELATSVSERLLGRPASDRESIRDNLLLSILLELTGNEGRAHRNLEALGRSMDGSPMWRWVLPASCLLGKVPYERLLTDTRCMPLFVDLTSASLFWMLGLVEKKRKKRSAANGLFRMAVKADPLNSFPAILARRELGKLTPGMKKFLATE